MRILFTTTPTFSHTTPMIPLAQAARLAGHQVLFAGGGVTLKTAAGAGIPVIDATSGNDLGAPHRRFLSDPANHHLPQEEGVKAFIGVMSEIGQLLLPGLVDTARGWEADIVVTPAWLPWGMLAARASGALAVLHGIGLRYPAVPYMADEPPAFVQRLGVTEFPAHADAEVSLGPASLEQYSPTAPGDVPFPVLPVRPITYNGSGEVPDWALRKSDRPRIAVTMGTATNAQGWPGVLRAVLEGTADVDAEVVLAAGGVDLTAITGPLPERVKVVDFVPLSSLLPRCDALVHHAGMNSMFSAFNARIPQVALPSATADSPINAMVLSRRGGGVAVSQAGITAEQVGKALREVLESPSYRLVSEEVADEMAAMPAPHAVVEQLTGLAAARGR
ncbi:nucleotide disphospho-sugar-binding domain-containing protein [Streptomyces sp. NPDC051976]|uniref:nucleotide disphospho-sugar-binding domain-containing protein n=1 Tax=Streptomyces sp. NPDC051976 TaxID=3154947 RepID=UPI003420D251